MSYYDVWVDPNPPPRPPRPLGDWSDNIHRTAPPVDYEPSHPLILALLEACEAHDLSAVKALVDSWRQNQSPPGPPEYPIGALEPAFYHAIRQDDASIASYFLNAGISFCRLAVLEALESKCTIPTWQTFLDHGWDINAPMGEKPPGPLADVLDNSELLTWFLEHGASPNAASSIGRTPFMVAAANSPLATVQVLQAYGAEVGNALPCAVRQAKATPGRLEVVRLLLDSGAPIDAVEWEHNARGFSSDINLGPALNLAVNLDCVEMVELLLERGARTDIVDYFFGQSVLEAAHKYASPRIVELLEEHMRADHEARTLSETSGEVRYLKPEIVDEPGGQKVRLLPFVLGKDDAAHIFFTAKQKAQKL